MKINEINTMRQGATEFIYRLVKFLSGGKIHAEKRTWMLKFLATFRHDRIFDGSDAPVLPATTSEAVSPRSNLTF